MLLRTACMQVRVNPVLLIAAEMYMHVGPLLLTGR